MDVCRRAVEIRGEGGTDALVRGTGGTILRELALGERSVSELVTATGMAQPNVSNHLARLRQRGLVLGERRGKQIVYRLVNSGIAHLLVANAGQGASCQPAISEASTAFVEAILTLREEEPMRMVDGALAAGLGWRELYLQVFVPALRHIGELWEQDLLPVADEHLITGIVSRIIDRLSLALPISPPSKAPTALVACVEGELHSIGGRMVSDFLLAQGWRVWFLGGYLSLEHLSDAVSRHRPDAVVLCISTEFAEAGLAQSVAWLQEWKEGGRLPLIVTGGRFFTDRPLPPGVDLGGTDLEAVTQQMGELVHREVE